MFNSIDADKYTLDIVQWSIDGIVKYGGKVLIEAREWAYFNGFIFPDNENDQRYVAHNRTRYKATKHKSRYLHLTNATGEVSYVRYIQSISNIFLDHQAALC